MKKTIRLIAAFLSFIMILGEIPVSAVAETFEGPSFTLQAGSSEEGTLEDVGSFDSSDAYFESRKGTYVSGYAVPVSANDEVLNSEKIGSVFRYAGYFAFEKYDPWQYLDTSKPTRLFSSYENIVIRVKAPAGIVLCNASGTPLDTDDGWVLLDLPSRVVAPSSDSVQEKFQIYAKMTGNGSKATPGEPYGKLSFDVSVDVTVATTDEYTEDTPQVHSIKTGDVKIENNTTISGTGEAEWTVRKSAVKYNGTDYVQVDGENIILTYEVEAGRSVNGVPASDNSNYQRYGMLDIASMTLTDTVSGLKDVSGKTVYPSAISVTPSNGVIINDDNTGFTADASSLNTLDASAYGIGEPVKAYTKYVVKETYKAKDFTYALTDPEFKDFIFKNGATMAYTTKDGSERTPKTDSDKIGWHDVAGGGSLSVSELFFLTQNATAEQAKPYNEFYQNCFGPVKYTLYRADDNGDPIFIGQAGEKAWSRELLLANGINGTVAVGDNSLPVGKIAIVPDYSGTSSGWVTPVSDQNGQAPAHITVDIIENRTSSATFGLRYVDGGFISAEKAFYDREGNKLTNSEAKSLLKATQFVFTPVAGSGDPVTMQIGTDAKGEVAVRPGEYRVTEVAPEGYVAAGLGAITVGIGEEKALNNGAAVKNYPAQAVLKISAKTTDQWVSGDAAKTDSGAASVTDSALTYVIQKKENDAWVSTGITVSLSKSEQEIYLDRYDENGDLIEYRVSVAENGDGDRTRLGSILEKANAGMSAGGSSVEFTFGESNMIRSLVWYYRNFASVKVIKTVNDIRTAEPALNGWAFSLFAEGNEQPVATGSTADDGTVEFTGLVKTDESGNYINYYVKETVDAGVWETAYVPAGSAEQSGTVSFEKSAEKEIKVTNTVRQGSITFTKVDADNNKLLLSGAKYRIFTVEDGKTLWLTSGTDADTGARLFSEAETDAEIFETNASGVISVSNIPSGHAYSAIEVTAPADYFSSEDAVALGTLASGEAKTAGQVKDTHHPYIKVIKRTVDISGNNKKVPKNSTATFALYVKDSTGSFSAVNGITFTATAGSESYSFASGDYVVLPDYGEYYLVETSASANILMPSVQEAPSGKQKYTTITVDGQEYLAHGPYEIKANDQGTAVYLDAKAYDVVNTASLTVSKVDAKTEEAVTASLTYVVAARIKDGDADTLALLGSGWTTTDPTGTTGDFEAVAGAAGTGYKWYFSPDKSDRTIGLPLYDGDDSVIDYYVIEKTAPEGYYNKVNTDGTTGYHVVKAAPDTDKAVYSAKLSDAPKMDATVSKVYQYVWDMVSGNAVAYIQPGVTIALYHVNGSGVLDHLLASKQTNGILGAVFDNVPMDFRERYFVVETNSDGFDTRIDSNNKTSGKTDIEPSSLVGQTVSAVSALYNCRALNFSTSDLAVDTAAGPSIMRTLTNYVPYIQFIVTKRGLNLDDPANPVVVKELLNQSKFKLYTISESSFVNDCGSDAATAVTSGKAKTDGYVYESGMLSEGKFATLHYDYDDHLVFIFEETEPTPGYQIIDKYTAVTFGSYEEYQNSAMPVTIDNKVLSGGGDGSVRYYRVELDKYVDRDNSGRLSDGDAPLADVTFTLALADKDGKRVFDSNADDPFYTFFTTGTDTTGTHGHGYARSETMELSQASVKKVADKGKDPDDVFTFRYKTGTNEYVTKKYADYIGAKQRTAAQEGDLIIDNFELTFKLMLTEKSYPLNVTPYNINYYVTITTAGGTVTDKTYTYENNNPILNVSGKYVLAQARKFVENGKRWSPKTEDDYVEFRIVLDYCPDPLVDDESESVKNQTVRINTSNYNNLPTVYLLPNSKYHMVETHAPIGYDKPTDNRIDFETRDLETRVSDEEDVRVQKIDLTDTPYVTFTVTKQDSAKAAVSGKTLKVVYSSGNNAGAVLDANAEALGTDVTVMTTDASGNAVFTLPKYDYRTVDDYGASKTNASYTVIELENGERAAGFDVLNGTVTTVKTDKLTNITVSNPEPADVRLIKIGVSDAEYRLANVSFDLYYAPFNEHREYADANAPAALADNSTRWQLKAEAVGTDENGEIRFNGLYSGYYKLVETIPEAYMYEGKAYTVQFVLVTPGDAASLGNIRSYSGKYWEGTPVTILSQRVSDKAAPANQAYNKAAAGYTDGAITLTVKNTHKGALDITKLFETNTVDVTIPSTVKYYVIKGKDTVETVDVAISGASGSAKATLGSYILLEPGTYTVVEETEKGDSFFATVSVSGSGETIVEPEAASGKVRHTVGNVVITSANTIADEAVGTTDNPVTVDFTNRTAAMRIVAQKVDDTGEKLEGAGFVVIHRGETAGTTYFYTGADLDNGMGSWVTDETRAKIYETNAEGILSIDFTADYQLLKEDTVGSYTDSYGIREVKADEKIRKLVEDHFYDFEAGKTLDVSGDESKYLVDGTGLAVNLVLHGRTYEHAKDDKETPLVRGAVFKLYKIDYLGNGTLVDSYTEEGVHISEVTTDGNGEAGFCYLDPLKSGERYALVETSVADGYHGTDTYTGACIGTSEQTAIKVKIGGKEYPGYVIFTKEESDSEARADHVKTIDVYNMPYSRLLVLKYDYDYPKLQIPVNAEFSVKLDKSDYPGSVELEGKRVRTDTAADAGTSEAAQEQGYAYSSAGRYIFSDSTADYSFFEITDMLPGSYTITETKAADTYFYTPKAVADDPWYPVKSAVIDDDGGLTVVRFANVPNPEENGLSIDKAVSDVKGKGPNGELLNLQELCEDGQRQRVTFTISDFAPGKGSDGIIPAAVKYPMNSLTLKDEGMTFEDSGRNAVENVDYRIEKLTVGKANYLGKSTAFNAVVYGITASGESVKVKAIDTGSAAQEVDMTGGKYVAFRIEYGPELDRIDANFKAEPVTVEFSMLQGDDANTDLARKITNKASVTMGYDIGTANTEFTFTLSDTADVAADTAIVLPTAKVLKVAQIKTDEDEGGNPVWGTPITNRETVYVKLDDEIRYTLTYTNTDIESTGLAIPDPFVTDVVPECIDVTAVTAETIAGSELRLDDPVTDGHQIYVKGSGMFNPGKEIRLIITGKVNAAKILDAVQIQNVVYAGSTEVIGINKQNPKGAPFKAEGGAAPANQAPGEPFGSYAAVMDSLNHTFTMDGTLMIAKTVAGEVTGKTNFMSGSENIAVTNPDGEVYYRLTVKSTVPVRKADGGLRIADILPMASNDVSINGALRFSQLAVTLISGITVSVGDYDVYYTKSTDPAVYREALTEGASGANWSTDSTGAKGFFIQVNEDISEKDTIKVSFTCRAPEAVADGDKTVYNYYKQAINTASAWAPGMMKPTSSNPAHVTILPDFKAAVGDRVWLDKNANGMQDDGEPDFALPDYPGVSAITLRTYWNDQESYSSGSAETLTSGKYGFGGLSGALLKGENEVAYDAKGDAVLRNFNGTIRYFYQLAVNGSAIPEGYIVTNAYAKNGGNTTTFAVEKDDATGLLVYKANGSDGHEADSDFRKDGDKYVTSRFYLPLQVKDGEIVKEAVYNCFDLGLIRTRDLKITKMGADGKPVAGAKFKVYGPFAEEEDCTASDATLLTTLEATGENGCTELISDGSTYLNYYSYYLLVEEEVPAPYTASILSFESNTGNASLTEEKGNTILLTPADESGTVRVEEIGVTDEFVAHGTFTLTQLGLNKVLDGADITSDFFKNLFTFSYTSDDPLFGEARSMHNEAGLIVDSKGNEKINIVVRRPLGKEEALEYTYTFTENDVKIKVGEDEEVTPAAISKDDTVYTLKLTITDADGDGILEIASTMLKGTEEVDKFTFTNTLDLGDLTIAKEIKGTPADAPETFAFTVVLKPETGLEQLVLGQSFTAERTPAAGGDPATETVAFDAKGEAVISLADGESVTIKNIPVNTAYTVTEADYSANGYLVTEINGTVSSDRKAEGTVGSGETGHEYTYANVRNAGDLIVSKSKGGNAFEEKRDFTFTVVLEREDGVAIARSYDAVRTEADQTTTEGSISFEETDGVVSATFKLRGGQSLRITNIESGTKFKVTEQSVGRYGYAVTSEGAEGSIPEPGEDGKVADSEAAFTNTRNAGTLSIVKKLSGNAAGIQETFDMNVRLTYPEVIDLGEKVNLPKLPEGCTHSGIKVDGHDVTFTVTLKADEKVTVTDILYGASFTVSEKDYTGRGYDAPAIDCSEGTINAEQADMSVTVTNERNVGSLALTKLTDGTGRDFRDVFDFTLRLTYDLYETRGIVPDLKDEANVPVADIGAYVKETRIVCATDTAPGYVEYDVQLPAGKTLTISNILVDTQYEIVETDYSGEGYLVTEIDNNGTGETGLEAKGNTSNAETAVKYTNIRNANRLNVTKELSGNGVSYDRPFEFTITLLKRSDAAKIDRTYPASITDAEGIKTDLAQGAKFEPDEDGNAVYVFTLKGGETLSVFDIISDTEYVVEETDADCYAEGYVTSGSPSRGTVKSDEVSSVTVLNERNLGRLKITKELAGNSPRAITEFEFTITLKRTDGVSVAGTYTTGENGKGTIVFKETGSGSARATVKLAGGQSLIINDILAGTSYTVTEEDYGYEGYSTEWRNAAGRISETAVASAVCTNTRNTGELSITKTVNAVGMGIPGQAYLFTVNLYRPNGTGFNGTLKTDGGSGKITFINGTGTVSLKHGETVTIKDILVGSTYTVTEEEYPNTTVTSSGASGEITTDGADCLFENTVRQIYTNLTIVKEFRDDNVDRPASVTVRVSNRDGVVGDYVLSKGNGWRVTINNLPRYDDRGEEYIYSVVEVGSTEGYHVVYSVRNGVVTVTNIRKDDIFNDGFITIWDDLVAKGGGINMNEGYCFD